jgi:hypothetical protein
MSSKQVEHSSAAAIASMKSSLTNPLIDDNLLMTFRAICAKTQHEVINIMLIMKSVIVAILACYLSCFLQRDYY